MSNTTVFTSAIPVLPALDLPVTVRFYQEKLGFSPRHQDAEYAILLRDHVELHFWKCDDKNIADNSSCRMRVEHVADLYGSCQAAGVVHPNGKLETKPWGTTEFTIVDPNGNCLCFFERAG